MVCATCGAENPNNAAFCGACGNRLVARPNPPQNNTPPASSSPAAPMNGGQVAGGNRPEQQSFTPSNMAPADQPSDNAAAMWGASPVFEAQSPQGGYQAPGAASPAPAPSPYAFSQPPVTPSAGTPSGHLGCLCPGPARLVAESASGLSPTDAPARTAIGLYPWRCACFGRSIQFRCSCLWDACSALHLASAVLAAVSTRRSTLWRSERSRRSRCLRACALRRIVFRAYQRHLSRNGSGRSLTARHRLWHVSRTADCAAPHCSARS